VNLIGEHTDYNEGLVLPAALDLRTAVAVRLTRGDRVRGLSREEGPAEAAFEEPARGIWLDYVRGVARELARAGRAPATGFEVAVASDVPCGAGLSSSAALEVATALALEAASGGTRSEEPIETARLCQRAESGFVGVPCGLLDPFASLLAREGHVTLLDCATMRWDAIPVPDDLALLVVDTGIRRTLRDGGYAERRRECERALDGAPSILGRPLRHLSEIRPEEIGALGGLPALLLRRLRHVVTENARVRSFVAALGAGDREGAGRALYGSHESLRDDYEVTWPESDLLVDVSARLPGVVGARMTGAGWGGCTVHLVEVERAAAIREALEEAYAERFGRRPPSWLTRPGPGARVRS
jgi:galactokinase